MIADASQTFPRAVSPSVTQDKDRQRAWFALALPVVMAILLALVPLIGKAAAGPIVLLLVPLVLWAAFRDTERAIYVYIAWCWMDGTIRGLFDSNPIIVVARDIVLGVIIIVWAARRLPERHTDPIRLPPGTLLVSLFAINCILQCCNPYSLGLMSNIAGLKMHLSAVPLLFIGYDVFRRSTQVRSLLLFLILATAVIGTVSVIEYLQGPSWTYDHFPGSRGIISQNIGSLESSDDLSNVGFKPPGTTTFGGATGAFLGYALPMTFVLLLLSQQHRFGLAARGGFVFCLFAFVVAIFLNGVRSGFVSGVACLIVFSIFIKGQQRARTLGLVLICLMLGQIGWISATNLSHGNVANRFGSTMTDPANALHKDRQTFFDQFDDLITKTPLGVGMGRLGPAMGQFSSNKNAMRETISSEAYLGDMMAETGIEGALLIAAIAVMFLWRGFLVVRYLSGDEASLAACILSILAVIAANFFTTPILFGPPGSVLFWLLGAVLMRGSSWKPNTYTSNCPV